MFSGTLTISLFMSIFLCVQSKSIDMNRRQTHFLGGQIIPPEVSMQSEELNIKNDFNDDNRLYRFSKNDVVVELLPHRGFDGPISTEDDSLQQITEQQPKMVQMVKSPPLSFDSVKLKTGDEDHPFHISPQLLDESVSNQQINERQPNTEEMEKTGSKMNSRMETFRLSPPLSNELPEPVYVDEKEKRSHYGLPKVCHPIKKRRKCFHLMIAEKKIYKICKNVLEKICSSLDK